MYLVRPPYIVKQLFPKAIWRMNTLHKKIYLTFDDGPIPDVTPWVLDLLKKEKIKATFFCVGENVDANPEIYKQILKDGHSIGNHTYNHLNGWKTLSKKYIRNVYKCSNSVQSHLFRPPYGKIRNKQISTLKSQYAFIMWDVLSGDYDKKTSSEKCLKNVTSNVRNGSIIIFHDSLKAQKNMEYALPKFISFAKEKGFEFEKIQ
jgi:peptidoglycan/xylan/chitin deacetylase (PgdA/CDA1 family)